jgi:hypothetical protein
MASVRLRTTLWAVRAFVASAVALAATIILVPSARAVCAYDPDALSPRQMIVQGTTGDERFDVLFLGRVVRVRDLGEDRGGDALARFRVREHPVGFAPDRARVRFWRPPPGLSVSDSFEFHRGHRYAVVGHRRSTGVFRFDGPCGQTRDISRQMMWRLIDLFRHR